MIIYDLICDNEHRFEGWFHSADDFSRQCESGQVHCPQCDTPAVRRIPSAVAIGGPATGEHPAAMPVAAAAHSSAAMIPSGTQVMALYRQFVQSIVSGSEDVGDDFAAEARRIHYQEAPERSIRGNATPEEREALKEEGIDVLHLPLPREEDLN